MKKNIFSVVTVCYNAKKTIEDTIKSIISQEFIDFEYIIIDGGSTDGTIEIIEVYRDSIDIFVSEPDGGIYNAMNKASSIATGDYIIYMNSNDIFVSKNILIQVNDAIGNREYSVIYGDYYLKINNNQYLVSALNKAKGRIVTSHQAIFCKTSFVQKIKFDENLKLAADYKLLTTLLAFGPNLSLNFPVCVMEGVGFSSDKKTQILKEYFYINLNLFGLFYSSKIFIENYTSMFISNLLFSIGLGAVRDYLRKVKGWKLIKFVEKD
jgi:glycosyltransferase involved in cell wall biosynthesis